MWVQHVIGVVERTYINPVVITQIIKNTIVKNIKLLDLMGGGKILK
tara:strand:- start:250 stop:387 length:138 start_codon:yes stop_codon:yes gene_type:complete